MNQDKMHLANKIFNNETIRTVWDKEQEKYFISILKQKVVGNVEMIKLSQVRDALYDVSMKTSCYFNIKTNEILWHFDFNEEESTYTEEDEFNEDY